MQSSELIQKQTLGTLEDHHVHKPRKRTNEEWHKEHLIALELGVLRTHAADKVTCCDSAASQSGFKRFHQGALNTVLKQHYVEQHRPAGCTEKVKTGLFHQRLKHQAIWQWFKKNAGILWVLIHEQNDPIKAAIFKRNFFGFLRPSSINSQRTIKVQLTDNTAYAWLSNLRRESIAKDLRLHQKWESKYGWSYKVMNSVKSGTVHLQAPAMNLEWISAHVA